MVVVGLVGCAHTSSGLGRLTFVGQVAVTKAGGSARRAHSGQVLAEGDQVHVTVGVANVRLASSGTIELRVGTILTLSTTARLSGGAILIQPTGGPIAVAVPQGTLVVRSGAAQLAMDSPAQLVAKVYRGTSQLDVKGYSPTTVAAPREVDLSPTTHLPAVAIPLHYLAKDPWDTLYLASAEQFSGVLSAAAVGFDAQVPATTSDTAAFYLQLLPSLSSRPDFVSAFNQVVEQQVSGASGARAGDYLIASVIAQRGTHGTFATRLAEELAFSAQGAPWGFVAYDQGVMDLNDVLDDVLIGIGRADLPFAAPVPGQITLGPPAATGKSPTIGSPSQPGASRTTVPSTTPTTTAPNSGSPHPPITATTTPPLIQLPVPLVTGPLGSILNPLLDPLIQALNNILAGKG
jgi:hypothetical protein